MAVASHVFESTQEDGGTVKFFTSTFGHVARLATFRHIHCLAGSNNLDTRVWSTVGNGDLHVKLFV